MAQEMLDSSERFIVRKRPVLKCKRLSEYAVLPRKASFRAIGADLCSAYDYVIRPNTRQLCMTDLALECPRGCYGRIAPRGSISLMYQVDVAAGVIDPDYRGNVGIVLVNVSEKQFQVKAGQPIAQLILERAIAVNVQEVLESEDLSSTARGEDGWGSTNLEEVVKSEDLSSTTNVEEAVKSVEKAHGEESYDSTHTPNEVSKD